MKIVELEPTKAVDVPVHTTDKPVTQATRIHRSKRGAPWSYGTALIETQLFDPRINPDVSHVIEHATQTGVNTLGLRLRDFYPDHEAMVEVRRQASKRSIGLSLDLSSSKGDDQALDLVAAWIDAGVAAIDVTRHPGYSGLVAGQLMASDQTQIRTMLVPGANLQHLSDVLSEDWIEVTRSNALSVMTWNPDKLIGILTEFYRIHEHIGSYPAWEVTHEIAAADLLTPETKVLVSMALPGSVTIDIDEARYVTHMKRATRYREEMKLEESSLSYVQKDDLVVLISSDMFCYINFGSEDMSFAAPGRILVSTGATESHGVITLPGHSAAWVDLSLRKHPIRHP